jgi:hypothetical protein
MSEDSYSQKLILNWSRPEGLICRERETEAEDNEDEEE